MGWTDRPDKRYPALPLLKDTELVEVEPDQRYLTHRYTRAAVEFIEAHSDQHFFLYLPHSMPHWPQYASEDFAGKSANGAWGDAVEEIDWSTGVLLETLKEQGIDEQTIVIFMSDNGGAIRHGASNSPLKGGKGSTDEGGQRVCGIVRWPGQIPCGVSTDLLTTSMDWYPTLAALAGAELPADRPIDGKDIRDILFGLPTARSPHERFLYYKLGTLECVRVGDWKLRRARHPRRRNKAETSSFTPQLYNLANDIGEAHDVADSHPEKVRELEAIAQRAAVELGDRDIIGVGQRAAGLVEDPRALTDPTGAHFPILQEDGFEVLPGRRDVDFWDPKVLIEELEGCCAVIAGSEPYTRDVINALPNLRVIARTGVGFDAIDLGACDERGVVVTTTPGVNHHAVAEHTIALLMGVSRGFPDLDQRVRTGRWKRIEYPRVMGRTLGVVGLGRIGQAVVTRAAGLGMKILAHEPFPNEDFVKEWDVELVDLDDLLGR
ncbi:Steryl-sulfatase (Arylsulfatase C) (ASC) (Steroid sulfatase) (Steryl-sulfate sulfohydrolase), partial [Durusdinium trenchii]